MTVTLDWEADALVLTIANPTDDGAETAPGGGHGFAGVRERVESLGGFASLRRNGGEVRLTVLVPTVGREPEPSEVGVRAAALGVATAVLLFGALPAAMLMGAG